MDIVQQFLKIWQTNQGRIAAFLFMCMIAGMMWSRALLSVSIVVAFANALHPATVVSYWRDWRHNKFARACFLFFLAYVLSGFWSADKGQWWDSVTNKLPFVVLPFAVLALPLNEKRTQRLVVAFLLLTQLVVIAYSTRAFVSNVDYYIHAYNISHSLPTTKYDDHIRFSLSLVASLVVLLYYLFDNKTVFHRKKEQWALGIVGVIFILYLHLLAAKTGLIVLYAALLSFSVYWFVQEKNARKIMPFFWALLIGLPVILYFLTPTFKKKVDYVGYEFRKTTQTDSLNYNLSDAGRLLSYKMALKVWQQHKWLGTGAGDIKTMMMDAYQEYHPEVPAENRLIPHNQFLFCWLALGSILSLSLLILCWRSFFEPGPPIFYGKITSVIMIVAMLAEAMLEIQFGVFIFLFFLLFWQKVPMGQSPNRLS